MTVQTSLDLFEQLENHISNVACDLDKINTLAKLMHQMLCENTDFNNKDCLNVCSVLINQIGDINLKMTNLESSAAQYKNL